MKHSNLSNTITLSPTPHESDTSSLLERIIGDNSQKVLSNPLKKFVTIEDFSLEEIAKSFEPCFDIDLGETPFDDMMDSFISKHASHSFSSIDELLEASIHTNTYEPKKIKSLSDILDGLIEDL